MNKQITPTKSALNFESRIAGLLGDLIHMSQTQDLRIQAIEKLVLYLMEPRTEATAEKAVADLEFHKAKLEALGRQRATTNAERPK